MSPLSPLYGLSVYRCPCEPPRFLRWKRSHRKKRINKKWHKKYGAVYEQCGGVAYVVGRKLYICAHGEPELKKLPEGPSLYAPKPPACFFLPL